MSGLHLEGLSFPPGQLHPRPPRWGKGFVNPAGPGEERVGKEARGSLWGEEALKSWTQKPGLSLR